LAAEAVAGATRILCLRISRELNGPGDIGPLVRSYVHTIADRMEASGFRVGGPLTGIALETVNASEYLNAACRQAYDQVQRAFQDRCLAAGFEEWQAARFSLMITAAIEGATILSRTAHAGEPLRAVGDMLGEMLSTAHRGLLRPSHAG
jgi:hypothetical protein